MACLFVHIGTLTSLKQPIVLNLPQLKQLDISGTCALFDIFKAAPNLDDLLIDYDCLKFLIDDHPTCGLLEQRIIRLVLFYWPTVKSDLLQPLFRVFRRLRHLCLNPRYSMIPSAELFLSSILSQANIKQLTTLIIGIKVSDEINENLRQWVIDHTELTIDDSFAVVGIDNRFILWK